MGYIIRKVKSKRRNWKVQFLTFRDNKQKVSDIRESDMLSIGFRPSMSIEEAISRKNQLNALEHVKRHEARRVNILSKLRDEKVTHLAFLGSEYVQEFEQDIVFHRKQSKVNRLIVHWRAAQRTIVAVKLEPQVWHKKPETFYDYFSEQCWSISYVQKVLYILNRWGDFVTEKTNQRFRPIPFPTGHEKSNITDNHFDKKGKGNRSDPLLPLQLEKRCNDLGPNRYNWLYLSIWLGLRPKEVDTLLKPSADNTWYFKDNVLWVYQSKLKGIPREQRIKPIPLLQPEQLAAKQIIESQNFKRPLVKTLKLHFGPNVNTYAGRKGFVDLMLSFGYKLEDISVWMGHQSIERTWKSYKNKQTFSSNLSILSTSDKT